MGDRQFVCPVLLLAAGRARRMRGRDKLLQRVDGAAILRSRAEAALATDQQVIVVLPPQAQEHAQERRAVLEGLAVRIVIAEHAGTGMAASLVAGVAALPSEVHGVMVLLGDLPELRAEDLGAVMTAARSAPNAIWRGASEQGIAGHPVFFPARIVPELGKLSGDAGAKEVIRAHSGDLRLCTLPGHRAITDLDTPEEWAAWRAARGHSDTEDPSE